MNPLPVALYVRSSCKRLSSTVNLAVTWKVTETRTTAGLNFRVRFSASFSREVPKTDPAIKVAHKHSRAIFFKIELLEDSILPNFSETPLSVRRGGNVKWPWFLG